MNPKIRVTKGERVVWGVCIVLLWSIIAGWFLKACDIWGGF
jgi:hypothetical protein